MRDLVFVKFNSRLKQKRERKDRDRIVKEIDDVLLDNGNEFITGVVPPDNEDQESGDRAAAETQPQSKRKRIVQPRKKKIRSIQSLMRNTEQLEASTSSSESESLKPLLHLQNQKLMKMVTIQCMGKVLILLAMIRRVEMIRCH